MAHNRNSGCVCCNRIRKKAPWDKCLDDKDISGNLLCLATVYIPSDSVIQPHPSHHSHKFRQANIVKQPGNTAYGRWRNAKWCKNDRPQYKIL